MPKLETKTVPNEQYYADSDLMPKIVSKLEPKIVPNEILFPEPDLVPKLVAKVRAIDFRSHCTDLRSPVLSFNRCAAPAKLPT